MPLLIALLTGAATLHAQEADTAPPDAELLEFIASFATEDGGWLDPLELDVATLPDDTEDEVPQ